MAHIYKAQLIRFSAVLAILVVAATPLIVSAQSRTPVDSKIEYQANGDGTYTVYETEGQSVIQRPASDREAFMFDIRETERQRANEVAQLESELEALRVSISNNRGVLDPVTVADAISKLIELQQKER